MLGKNFALGSWHRNAHLGGPMVSLNIGVARLWGD